MLFFQIAVDQNVININSAKDIKHAMQHIIDIGLEEGACGNIVFIQTLRKVLHPTCILEKSWLGVHANTLVDIILSIFTQQSTLAQRHEASQAKSKKTKGKKKPKRLSAK